MVFILARASTDWPLSGSGVYPRLTVLYLGFRHTIFVFLISISEPPHPIPLNLSTSMAIFIVSSTSTGSGR